jgi:hypothetical protein
LNRLKKEKKHLALLPLSLGSIHSFIHKKIVLSRRIVLVYPTHIGRPTSNKNSPLISIAF